MLEFQATQALTLCSQQSPQPVVAAAQVAGLAEKSEAQVAAAVTLDSTLTAVLVLRIKVSLVQLVQAW